MKPGTDNDPGASPVSRSSKVRAVAAKAARTHVRPPLPEARKARPGGFAGRSTRNIVNVVDMPNDRRGLGMYDPVLGSIAIDAVQTRADARHAVRAEDPGTGRGRSERIVARDQRHTEVVVGCIEWRDDVAEARVLAWVVRQVVTELDEALAPVDVRIVDPCDPSPPPAGDLVEVGKGGPARWK